MAPTRHTLDTTCAHCTRCPGWAQCCFVVGGWYVAAWVIGGNDFFVEARAEENLFRVIDRRRWRPKPRTRGRSHMLPNFLVGAAVSLLIPAIAWWLWRMRLLDATTRYLVVWFIGTIFFYSIPPRRFLGTSCRRIPRARCCSGSSWVRDPGDGPRKLAGWSVVA